MNYNGQLAEIIYESMRESIFIVLDASKGVLIPVFASMIFLGIAKGLVLKLYNGVVLAGERKAIAIAKTKRLSKFIDTFNSMGDILGELKNIKN